jgi:FkbM family methyltransferase
LNLTFLDVLLEGYLAAKRRMNFVQIGANDGKINDPIFPFVMRNRTVTRILLIEPQPEIVPFLRENYADHPDATIYGGAIGIGEALLLFRVKPQLWNSYNPPYMQGAPAYRVPSGFASSSIQHVRRHAEGNFRIDARLEDCIEEISVPCTTLHALISRLSWDHDVDVLQIDAEGADDEVIYASDTDRLRPRLINYERSHLTEERGQRLEAFLTRQGYRILHWSGSDTAAILQSDDTCLAELAQATSK